MALASPNWYAHEVLYGFIMAVVAGFLLTAVKNWTGVRTLQNTPLLVLCSMWLVARICMLLDSDFFIAAAVLDISSNAFLFIAVLQPLFFQSLYLESVFMSKLLWIAALTLFFLVNLPLLTQARVDGAEGVGKWIKTALSFSDNAVL